MQFVPLLLLFVFLSSCQEQVETRLPANNSPTPQAVKSNPKLIRSQAVSFGNIYGQLQDRAGNIWFGSSGQGLYRYDGQSFTNFTTQDGLIDNDVREIIENRAGNILIATPSGICQYDGVFFSKYAANADWNHHSMTCLLEDRMGNLWFGTMDSGVYRYDGKTLTKFLNDDDHPFNLGTHDQLIMDILQDKKGNLWFSSWNGGGVWRYDGQAFTNFLPPADYYRRNEDGRSAGKVMESAISDPTHISDDMIFSMMEDRAGNLWFATRRHGACRYNGKTFTSFREAEGFVSYGIYSILEDTKGDIWLTTEKNGVWQYDGTTFKNFTTNDGLINNSVFSVLEDRSGYLWFGTRGFGLSRYDGKTFSDFSEAQE